MHFSPFAHLHVHSDYSLLASALSVSSLLDKVAELHQPAVALTDHGNLFGAVEFYAEALKRGIKPILGCEVFLCPDHRRRDKAGPRQPNYPHLLLLARTNQGWRNLMRLVSISYLDGFYYKPRVDRHLLGEYGDGLIALSSGWHGEVETHLRQGNGEAAREAAASFKALFPNHSFFLELQRHGAAGQEALNRQIIELAHALDIPLVATNNVHFLAREDFHAFEAMLAVQQNKTLADDVSGHYTPECYLKAHEEMLELYADVPEAVENALHVASRCNVELEFGHYQLPDYKPPDGATLEAHMHRLAVDGLERRWPAVIAGHAQADRHVYEQRLMDELNIIERMGYAGYFLIVGDFIRWAKDKDIPVGPGRGSGAGSLVAYSLGITDLDPIRYGLLFERFLNPERVSMPDFDVDFCMSRRDEVIDYVTRRYGADRVAQIITFGSMKAKAVVRDVGRVLGLPYAKVDGVAKLIPNALNVTLNDALAAEPRLKQLLKEDDEVAHLFDIARRLEGLHRHAGKHAAGVVIGCKPLVETAPLYRDPREGAAVVQWDMKCAEKVGLIKFDFLGLKTLTVLHLAGELVRSHGRDEAECGFDPTHVPLDDDATYKLLQRGDTAAVFQLESSGMRDLLTRIKPDCFEDIIALVALYRPGPLQSGMVDDFIERKHGRNKVKYPLPQLEPILAETYGVILYQEQVMKIAQELAGYSLGQADLLRRAMGKKKPEEMAKQRQVFLKGAASCKVPEKKAAHIFDLMEKFAGYGFNKSHSAAYALIAYQTAYVKAHYPQAYMAATLSCDMGDSDKVQMLINDCRNMGLTILPPDINASAWEFVPEGEKGIRFGLGAVKGVGEAAVREVLKVREQDGPFASFEDLLLRVEPKALNKRMLEALIKAGAMDVLVAHRSAALAGLARAMETAQRQRRDQLMGQTALFEVAEPAARGMGVSGHPAWSLGESLRHEREVLGFYLTGHPLEEYLDSVTGLADGSLADLARWPDGSKVVLTLGVSRVRVHHGGKGTMAFVKVEDLEADGELVCFPRVYARAQAMLEAERPLIVAARVDRSREEPSLIAEEIGFLDEVLPSLVECVHIHTSTVGLDEETVTKFKTLVQQHPGQARTMFHVRLGNGSMAEVSVPMTLAWCPEVQSRLKAWFGSEAVHLTCRCWQPQAGENGRHEERVQHVA